ncbi:MAG: PEP-CTERM-box response regulator transcription factor [Pseudomonadota bacterium]
MEKLLIIDDDPGIVRSLKWAFDDYDVVAAEDRPSGVAAFERHKPKVVTLDLGLPPAVDDATEGLATLAEILKIEPATKVIVVSGNEDRTNAVKAVANGAYDFYGKPIDAEVLGLIVRRAFHVHQLEQENRALQAQNRNGVHGLMTADDSMLRVVKLIEKVAPSSANVLILGESGTGKELVARALHNLSDRGEGRFIAINCAAIPENLLESELFGYEKGAFTGAAKQTIGKIELAHKGTLFLDEIGDMPMALQAKLLRFIQERQIERVGGRQTIDVDTRIVSATHRNLQSFIEDGAFREDLFYRIGEISIDVPPLRERGADVVLLGKHFIDKYARENKVGPLQLADGAEAALLRHVWRGNVRELENCVKRAVILANGPSISAEELGIGAATEGASAPAVPKTIKDARHEAERSALQAAMEKAEGNLSAAAKVLGVSRPTLYNLLKQHDI